MKGYLSRIARQSGLQFPAPRGMAFAPRGGDRGGNLIAPAIEQSVMVAPEVPEPLDIQTAQAARSPERVDDAAFERRGPPRLQESSERERPRARRESVEGPVTRETRQPDEASPARPATARAFAEASLSRVAGQLDQPRVATAAFRERDPSASATVQSPLSDPRRSEASDLKAPTQSAGPVAEPKEFFTRTVELLSGEAVATADPQTILLREVQEWVAASPVELPAARAAMAPRDTNRAAEVAKPGAPEARAIRENRQVEDNPRLQPMEQKFELSIGSIDITIDEAEKPRAPEPRTARTEKTAPADERRFSRLRRGYL